MATFDKAVSKTAENHKNLVVWRAAHSLLGTDYALDNSAPRAAKRFEALSAMFDAGTISHLDRLGVASGWHCLEVGGGAGSVSAWLSERVGPTGRVVVTDIDSRFLGEVKRPNLEVCQHDIVNDPLPEGAFDLVHARLVLMHLPQPKTVLDRLVKALKPGGWLLDEEFDLISLCANAELCPGEELLKAETAFYHVLKQKGVELQFGRLLFTQLRGLGLADVSAEGQLSMWMDRFMGAALRRASLEQLREAMIQSGYITAKEFAHDIARLDDPSFVTPSPTLWAVQGRRSPSLQTTKLWSINDQVEKRPEPCGWSVL